MLTPYDKIKAFNKIKALEDNKFNLADRMISYFFYIIQTVFYIIQYTQSHGVNICSFGVIKLQNPNLHLSNYTPPLSQPFNP